MEQSSLAHIDLLVLIGRDTPLKRVATTKGGEYAGVCPICKDGGRHGAPRLKVWPMHPDGKGQWHCFKCDAGGDAIDYIRARDGCGYKEALEVLRLGDDAPGRLSPAAPSPAPRPAAWPSPPCAAWQAAAAAFCAEAAARLWAPAGAKALAYLHGRGLADATIEAAGLGYNAQELRPMREAWGLAPHPEHPTVWLPPGIVIPWWIGGQLWRVNIRRPLTKAQQEAGEDKYIGPAGWHNGLYNADALTPGRPVVLLEGELDALTVHQVAGDLVAAVATGSTEGARELPWLARLALAPVVLVAFDAEAPGKTREAVERAAVYWLGALGHIARRWRPLAKDPNSMAAEGIDVRAWIVAGLGELPPAWPGAKGPAQGAGVISSAPAGSPGGEDPRPDLAADSAKWGQVLAVAHAHDGGDPQGLYAGLSFLRCLGARLGQTPAGAWTFRLGALGDQAEQGRLYDVHLAPHAQVLKAILGRPSDPGVDPVGRAAQSSLW